MEGKVSETQKDMYGVFLGGEGCLLGEKEGLGGTDEKEWLRD
jgi:hypothetical protein